jgi:hypothetical protein
MTQFGKMQTNKMQMSRWEVGFCALLLLFSAWIMFHTFSYDGDRSTMLVSRAMWSDFAGTIPLIRSFSLGENWPPEYPIFPGLPIRYHYLFALLVGKLEATGVPLDWALNIPSTIGFFLILLMTFLLAKKWFSDSRIAALSVVFFLFNGSMGFVQFFRKLSPSSNLVSDIIFNDHFSAMGPWDGGNVLGVWHLLVFVSQRHFSVALGILLSFIYVCYYLEGRSRRVQLSWALFFGILIGLFPVFHKAVILIFAVIMSVYFLLLPRIRLFLFATGAVSILVMDLLWLLSFDIFGAPGGFGWYPGVMIQGASGLVGTVKFFWYQFGLHAILIPAGFCLASRRVRVAVLPAFVVLLIAFLFRFSEKEVLVGHKFVNFFLIIGQMLTALAVVKAYDFISSKYPRAKIPAFGATGLVIFFLTLSGIIDFLAIVNIPKVGIADVGANPTVTWFAKKTPRDAVIATSEFLYSPASIAGRKIFLGYGYFTDSAGYDTSGRMRILDAIYSGKNRDVMCRLLHLNDISYVEAERTDPNRGRPSVNVEYFRSNFEPQYASGDGRYAVYATSSMCDDRAPHRGDLRQQPLR